MQALILAGGEGTRLRPLTSTMAKPVVPLANRPHLELMIQWLSRHGVDEVILSCGFLAAGIRQVLGTGEHLGVAIRYVEEPSPLGTGGALAFAGDLLADRFYMLNGDILSDIDLTAQLAQHEATGASATIALIGVDDPSAYGLVRLRADQSVSEFLEKPRQDEIDTNLINAGAYILERSVLQEMPPPPRNVSIEREVFPRLVDRGLFGFAAEGYWIDIGTPDRYLQGTFDILEGNVDTEVGSALLEARGILSVAALLEGRAVAPCLIGEGSHVGASATVGGRAVLGRNVTVGPGSHIEDAILLDGASVGSATRIRSSIVGPSASIGDHCVLEAGVVVGANVRLGAENVLSAGARIFPGVELPDGAIRF
jgi:mannose-1-phosphate guanylyltransferase